MLLKNRRNFVRVCYVVDVVLYCRILHFIKSLQSANVLISQTAKRYQFYRYDKNTPQIILLHLSRATGKFK